jgi:RHH-type proline utilization regulon transcriptional repressor/proline dehydrogenase/delta 1-pyrroline-5-carboxylate dehydrogenase
MASKTSPENITDDLREAISNTYRHSEAEHVNNLLQQSLFNTDELAIIQETATDLVRNARNAWQQPNTLHQTLQQYDLSTEQGIALMCLAEALMRIPDQKTRDLLISDKIATINWLQASEQQQSLFSNAMSWSLLIAGKVFAPLQQKHASFWGVLKRTLSIPGIAIVRPFIYQAMKTIGAKFIGSQTIEEALHNINDCQSQYCFSFNIWGEAARTATAAQQHWENYHHAIVAIGNSSQSHATDLNQNAHVSLKLSALHPRYEAKQKTRVMHELVPSLLELVCLAQKYNIGVTIDAEESEYLELSLDIFAAIFTAPSLESWPGLGITVQAYQKRAPYIIDWLQELAHTAQKRIMLRLVKGDYWAAEIKNSQILGLPDYPVFTRKQATDLAYLVCAKKLLSNCNYFYPQFGTHNAYSLSAILTMAASMSIHEGFEFQCLYGMGAPLYDQIAGHTQYNIPVRIYTPIGSHENLVRYLIRRLVEKGTNNSFIKQLTNPHLDLKLIITDPAAYLLNCSTLSNPHIKLPAHTYPERLNSPGTDLSNSQIVLNLQTELAGRTQKTWQASAIVNGKELTSNSYYLSVSPANTNDIIGHVYLTTPEDIEKSLASAVTYSQVWAETPYLTRAKIIEHFTQLIQDHQFDLISLLNREAGKTISDALSEIRETLDYCYYYTTEARRILAPQSLPGPAGEKNIFSLAPRGLIVCLSPWNRPLAIFIGQIVAALLTGNVVIAKPAEQTPLIATAAVQLLHQAGIPPAALQLLLGPGNIGNQLVQDKRVAGVIFTGSTHTAHNINQALATRQGAIIPLIAETSGQNAMIVDSSALCEQVVNDIILSAFNSAGQHCSALRILFVQQDIADNLIKMLAEGMAELNIGNPGLIETDIGPIIDKAAWQNLQDHINKLTNSNAAQLLYKKELVNSMNGYYLGPCAFLLQNCQLLHNEIFGPILHVIPYAAADLDKTLDSLRQLGYGLTLGIHSRIKTNIAHIKSKAKAGNTYVNRNMIHAVAGLQPFGGLGLSGTGPKAGGPYYLPRLCTEKTTTTNVSAIGSDVTLLTLSEHNNELN